MSSPASISNLPDTSILPSLKLDMSTLPFACIFASPKTFIFTLPEMKTSLSPSMTSYLSLTCLSCVSPFGCHSKYVPNLCCKDTLSNSLVSSNSNR